MSDKLPNFKKLPKLSRLEELFSYDPVSGKVLRKISTGKGKKGSFAGHIDDRRGLRIGIDGFKYLLHRIAWKMHYGKDPDDYIVFLNSDIFDLRIDNMALESKAKRRSKKRKRDESKDNIKPVARFSAEILVSGRL